MGKLHNLGDDDVLLPSKVNTQSEDDKNHNNCHNYHKMCCNDAHFGHTSQSLKILVVEEAHYKH